MFWNSKPKPTISERYRSKFLRDGYFVWYNLDGEVMAEAYGAEGHVWHASYLHQHIGTYIDFDAAKLAVESYIPRVCK